MASRVVAACCCHFFVVNDIMLFFYIFRGMFMVMLDFFCSIHSSLCSVVMWGWHSLKCACSGVQTSRNRRIFTSTLPEFLGFFHTVPMVSCLKF